MYRIYCVEDDENIRELIVYALKSNGMMLLGLKIAMSLIKPWSFLSQI